MTRLVVRVLILALVFSIIGVWGWVFSSNEGIATSETEFSGISLIKPVFAQTVFFLNSEAGIAAYTKVDSVNLEAARNAYKIIEADETDHLIGIVDVYSGAFGNVTLPHAFVSADGWLVAYLLKDESIGWAWPFAHGVRPPDSALEMALNQIGANIGVALSDIKYYDFEYPTANTITVIHAPLPPPYARAFEVQVPDSFLVFEAAQAWNNGKGARLVENGTVDTGKFQTWKDALILIYREP